RNHARAMGTIPVSPVRERKAAAPYADLRRLVVDFVTVLLTFATAFVAGREDWEDWALRRGTRGRPRASVAVCTLLRRLGSVIRFATFFRSIGVPCARPSSSAIFSRACASRRRASSTYSLFSSSPTYLRPSNAALRTVVPLPLNGSSTTSPGLLAALMIRS